MPRTRNVPNEEEIKNEEVQVDDDSMAEKNQETLENTNEEMTNEEQEATEDPEETPARNNNDDYTDNKNLVMLRGVIQSISQKISDEGRQENVTLITTPNHLRFDNIVPGTVEVVWGQNERANDMIKNDFQAGDHVIIYAEVHSFRTSVRYGMFLYGLSIKKDVPNELTGLGDYDPPKNEAMFVGTLRSVTQRARENEDPENSRYRFLRMALHTESGDEEHHMTNAHPSVIVAGRVAQAFNRNREILANGKKIGVACNLQIRINAETGDRQIAWIAHDLIGYSENGEPIRIRIPRPFTYRAPRNTGNRRTRNVTVAPTENDAVALSKVQEAPVDEEHQQSTMPEGVADSSEEKQDVITYVNGTAVANDGEALKADKFSKEELRRKLAEDAYRNAEGTTGIDATI